jgi:hypothetical protein
VVNRLLKHVDALQGNEPGRTPMVLIGGGDFNTSQRGNRSSPAKAISRILATKFPVFFIDEHYTSKLCPKCFGELQAVKRTRNRHWVCKNLLCRSVPDHDFLVHKDKSAAINMFLCFLSLIMCGKRPKPFRKKEDGNNGDPGGGGGGGENNGGKQRKRKRVNNSVDPDDGVGNSGGSGGKRIGRGSVGKLAGDQAVKTARE